MTRQEKYKALTEICARAKHVISISKGVDNEILNLAEKLKNRTIQSAVDLGYTEGQFFKDTKKKLEELQK
ncbi:hypothetical protein [Bacillus pumilus]|uniref:hypothetical protein n=1 Tax=Bacillus pumilus TaxID=1408 RepID=UPI00119FC5E0|nr:hypothetical protein [Bacillus pumilus]